MVDIFRIQPGQSSSVNTVNVTQWGTAAADGKRRDCFWNIAKDQAGDGASDADVERIMEEIIAYNDSLSEQSVNKDTVIHTGEQIFIPLKYAMDEITGNIDSKTKEYDDLSKEVGILQGELEGFNTDVDNALGAYNLEIQAYNSAPKETEDGKPNPELEGLQSAMNEAKEKYMEALEKQRKKQGELQEKQEKMEQAKGTLDQYKTELENLKKEYDTKENEVEKELGEIDKKIEELKGKTETAQGELEKAQQRSKEAQDAAKADQEVAQTAGVTYNAEGKAVEPEGGFSAENVAEAAAAPASVPAEKPVSDKAAEKLKDVAGDDVDIDNAKVEKTGLATTYTVTDADGKELKISYKEGEDGELIETGRVVQNDDDSYTSYSAATAYRFDENNKALPPVDVTSIKTYTLDENGKEVLVSTLDYDQKYEGPESLKDENLTKRRDYSKDSNGQDVRVIQDYAKGELSEIRVEYADEDGKRVNSKMKPEEYAQFVKDNPDLELKDIPEAAAKPGEEQGDDNTVQERSQFFKDIQTDDAYKGEFVTELVEEYTGLQNKVTAGTATDAEAERAEKIFGDLNTYKTTIDDLSNLSNEETAEDKELARQLNAYGVAYSFKSDVESGAITLEQAKQVSDARVEILRAQADMIETYNNVKNQFDNMTPTQQLLADKDSAQFNNEFTDFVLSADSYNRIGDINDVSIYEAQLKNIENYKEGAVETFNYYNERLQNFSNSIDVETLVQNPKVQSYDKTDVVKLQETYDSFMTTAYENSAGFLGKRPNEIKETRESAEKLLKLALAGEGVSGGLNIESIIEDMERLIKQYNK